MKRKLKEPSTIALLCLGFFVAYVTFLHLLIDPFLAQREAKRLLSSASTQQQLQAAVGPLGTVYSFPDNSWLAIHYRDSHGGGIWSIAIARDSGGNWYESREHFCGAFNAVRQIQKLSSTVGSPTEESLDERGKWISRLSASPDLQAARLQITSRYFTRIQ